MFATMLPILRTLDLIESQSLVFEGLYRRANSPYKMTREMGGAISNAGLGYAIPLVVREDDSLLRIESELPGVGRDRIQISVADRTLFIRLFASDVTGAEFDPESTSNFVERRVTLASYIDPDSIRAAYADGLLQVEFDYVPAVEPRYVELSDSLEIIESPSY